MTAVAASAVVAILEILYRVRLNRIRGSLQNESITRLIYRKPAFYSLRVHLPSLIRGHKRLRALKSGAEDLETKAHTRSEHLSHGNGSYRRLHPLPVHVSRAEHGGYR